MEAKQYLRQVKLYDTLINNKIREKDNLKAMVTNVTATWKDDVVSWGGRSQDKLAEAVSRIVDLEKEITKEIDNYVDMKREIKAIIDQIKEPGQVDVLYRRYFLYETFEKIACDMHMTYRNVCYIHGKALESVKELR